MEIMIYPTSVNCNVFSFSESQCSVAPGCSYCILLNDMRVLREDNIDDVCNGFVFLHSFILNFITFRFNRQSLFDGYTTLLHLLVRVGLKLFETEVSALMALISPRAYRVPSFVYTALVLVLSRLPSHREN